MSQEQLEQLLQAVSETDRILILPHNNPDPDAIASAAALRYLLAEKLNIEGNIAYKGIIGRAENRALVRYLDYPMQLLTDSDLLQSTSVALVDTQPGAGNNPVSIEVTVTLVIDHNTRRDASRASDIGFADVRAELGATSTILAEYYQAADIEIPASVATALFYGIKTNTMGLARNTDPADVAAYHYLQPRIEVQALATIETARVPAHYFKSYDAALQAARVYDDIVISYLGIMSYPDLSAEMADLLLRLEEAQWVICMGAYENDLVLSVRTYRRRDNAERLVQAVVGTSGTAGGHGTIAGGQIPLLGKDPGPIVSQLIFQVLQNLNVEPGSTGKSLV